MYLWIWETGTEYIRLRLFILVTNKKDRFQFTAKTSDRKKVLSRSRQAWDGRHHNLSRLPKGKAYLDFKLCSKWTGEPPATFENRKRNLTNRLELPAGPGKFFHHTEFCVFGVGVLAAGVPVEAVVVDILAQGSRRGVYFIYFDLVPSEGKLNSYGHNITTRGTDDKRLC